MSGRRSLRRILLTSNPASSPSDEVIEKEGGDADSDSAESDLEPQSPFQSHSKSLPVSPLPFSGPEHSLKSVYTLAAPTAGSYSSTRAISGGGTEFAESSDGSTFQNKEIDKTPKSHSIESLLECPSGVESSLVLSKGEATCKPSRASLSFDRPNDHSSLPPAGFSENRSSRNSISGTTTTKGRFGRSFSISAPSSSSTTTTKSHQKESATPCPDSALCEFILRACALMALENSELKSRLEAKQHELQKEKLQKELLFSRQNSVDLSTAGTSFRKESAKDLIQETHIDDEDGGVLRKLNDMRQRLGFLKKRHDGGSSVRPHPDEVLTWAEDFNNLMASKYGQSLFKAFLQREFSEENVEFWLAVEDYKNTRSGKLHSKACKIHNDYVAVQSPKEINLDSATRSQITARLECPDKNMFDAAQKRVQALMESDAYLRFLQSELYKELLHPDQESNEDSS